MDTITMIFEFMANGLPDWLAAITALVVVANTITALTPTTSDDNFFNGVLKVLNFLSMNFGKNKNADA